MGKKGVDWASLGLEDFGPTFEKLGINSVNKLIDAAPYLERDHGLDGLCGALGIPNTLKNNGSGQSSSSSASSSSSSGSGSSQSVLMGVLSSKALQFLVIVWVLIALYVWIGGELGFVKGELEVSFSAENNASVNISEMSVVLVPLEREEIITAPLDENGFVKLKAKKDTYDIYLKYDGLMLFTERWKCQPAFRSGGETDISDIIFRALLVRFVTPDGEVIKPESAQLDIGTGKWNELYPVDGEWFAFYFGNDMISIPITFRAEGYGSAVCEYDWGKYRTTKLEVVIE